MKSYLEILSEVCDREVKLDEDINSINAREAARRYVVQYIKLSCEYCEHIDILGSEEPCSVCVEHGGEFKLNETMFQ